MKSPVIVALDYPNRKQAEAMAAQLDPARCRLKIGKELFTRAGPELIRELNARGFEIFLDLKFHDIPNTTASAVAAAADLGVWMVNVHASGGPIMMSAAREALVPFGKNAPLLIAVTVLTSMDATQLQAIGVSATPEQHVLRLARLAQQCDLDGVVCSAQECAMLRNELAHPFALVTPGIRPASSSSDDQIRIATPATARANGSDYLVIGRPITRAENPMNALAAILDELDISQ